MTELIVHGSTAQAAAYDLYRTVDSKYIDIPVCNKLTAFVECLPIEMPMGMTEKQFKKRLRRTTMNYAEAAGLVPGFWEFLAWQAFKFAVSLLIDYWVKSSGVWGA